MRADELQRGRRNESGNDASLQWIAQQTIELMCQPPLSLDSSQLFGGWAFVRFFTECGRLACACARLLLVQRLVTRLCQELMQHMVANFEGGKNASSDSCVRR